MDVILCATDTQWDVAEFTDYTTYVCVNFRKINCRQESVAIFHRKDNMEVYFCIGVCQFDFCVAAMRLIYLLIIGNTRSAERYALLERAYVLMPALRADVPRCGLFGVLEGDVD